MHRISGMIDLKRRWEHYLQPLAAALVVMLLTQCGSLEAEDPPSPPKNLQDSGSYLTERTLWWKWTCDIEGNVRGHVDLSDGRMVVTGGNQFILSNKDMPRPAQIGITGNLCTAAAPDLAREVVILVDVSHTMHDLDPTFDSTCRRAAAVAQTLARLEQEPDVAFSVFTFAGEVITRSVGFHRSAAALQRQWHAHYGFRRLEDALCVGHHGQDADTAIRTVANELKRAWRKDSSRQMTLLTSDTTIDSDELKLLRDDHTITLGAAILADDAGSWWNVVGEDGLGDKLLRQSAAWNIEHLRELIEERTVNILSAVWREADIERAISIDLGEFTRDGTFTVIPARLQGNARTALDMHLEVTAHRRWQQGGRPQTAKLVWRWK